MARIYLKATFPPNVQAVFGQVHPYEWLIDITDGVDPRLEKGFTEFATTLGPEVWEP
jgi:hypothetical protein